MVDVCVMKSPKEFHEWWKREMDGGYEFYLSILLLFFSLVIAMPLARFFFFLLHYLTPDRWIWPGEAQSMIMWETYWLLRIGLFCAALEAIRLTDLLCQWPLWIFGIPLLLWLNKAGDVIREVAVRRGSAKTLMYEITLVIKMFVLCMTFYFIYILIFPGIAEDILRSFYTGVCVLFCLALIPVVRNISGSQLVVFDEQEDSNRENRIVQVHFDNTPPGILLHAPMGYVLTRCNSFSKIYTPAGKTFDMPMVMAEENVGDRCKWPVSLVVELPSILVVSKIRQVILRIDSLLNHLTYQDEMENPKQRNIHRKLSQLYSHGPTAAAASVDERRESNEGWFVAVEGRWIIRIHGHIFATCHVSYRKAISQKIQQIMLLLESMSLQDAITYQDSATS